MSLLPKQDTSSLHLLLEELIWNMPLAWLESDGLRSRSCVSCVLFSQHCCLYKTSERIQSQRIRSVGGSATSTLKRESTREKRKQEETAMA